MQNKIFSILILVSLFLLGMKILFLTNQQDISYFENRELATNNDLKIADLKNGNFQHNVENILVDQFPERMLFVHQKNSVDYHFTNAFYKCLSNDKLLNPIGTRGVYQIGNSNVLMNGLAEINEERKQRVLNRIDQINQLQADYPEIEIFVYKPTQIHETSFFDEANGLVSAGPEYEKLFENLNVPYDSFKINELSDYPKYFYTTDHHWNNRGSYIGYEQIVKMMFGDQERPLEILEESCKNGLPFYGTFSQQSGYVTEPSEFCVYKFNLPKYKIYDLKGEMPIENTNTFFDKDIKQINKMDYHYNTAYRVGDGLTKIVSENTDKGNILIIGDSYGGPILPLLAEHFHEITFIYPTNYHALTKKEFDYDRFIEENDVDKILFMYTLENYFWSDEWGDRYKDFDIVRSRG